MLHFFKDWWKFIQIHQYYSMALSQVYIFRVKSGMFDNSMHKTNAELWGDYTIDSLICLRDSYQCFDGFMAVMYFSNFMLHFLDFL